MTLNLTTGAAAAWSERRALAFTATPLACGAPLLMQFNQGSGTPARGAYWPTASYAGRENLGDAGKGKGLSLATAITISGAAVSPNWGYHSSPLTAFVMTLFNVRLGAWLPNPGGECTQPGRERDMDLAMPRSSLRSLLGDLLGSAAAAGPSVYLSDGGHFENLGLYEMLRRRCRHILVVDAGQDAGCTYEDLGNALRKAAIDMNVTVRFEKEVLICGRNDRKRLGSAAGYAIATIKYPRYPDDATDCEGHLIYMKPTLLGKIPQDVRAFANDNPEFPHESTMDQFFAESRFESYRALGEFQAGEMIARIRAAVPETPEDEDGLGLDTFFEKAFETYPSGKHAADLPLHARVRSSGG